VAFCPGGSLIVLARGSGVAMQLEQSLKGVLERHWGADRVRPLVPATSFENLAGVVTTAVNPASGQPVPRKQFLVVDVGTCAGDGSAPLSAWIRGHRDIFPVLIQTQAVPRQTHFVDGLKLVEPRGALLCGEEVGDDRVWSRVFRRQLSFRVGPLIRDELGAITVLTPTVAAILVQAPETRSSVKELCDLVQHDQRALERELKRTHQRPPKELLVLFHALWSVKLRELAWRPENVAHYFGYSTYEAWCKELTGGLGISAAELSALSYRRMLALVVAVLPARGVLLEDAVRGFLTPSESGRTIAPS
jgi:hypothetical protein